MLLAIESLTYETGKKPTFKEVAERLGTYRDLAATYVTKYGLRDKCKIGGAHSEPRKQSNIADYLEKTNEILKEHNELIKELICLFK